MYAPPRSPVAIADQLPATARAMYALDRSLKDQLDPTLAELIKLRASQLNGCAYCLDMHTKDALAGGEAVERLALLPAWRESTSFDERERAALALTEAITRIGDAHVPADVEDYARDVFDGREYAAVVWAIIVINAWNRLAISAHLEPGHYQPGDHG